MKLRPVQPSRRAGPRGQVEVSPEDAQSSRIWTDSAGMPAAWPAPVCGNVLEVAGVDVLDGTPLLDVKPYIAGSGSRAR